MSYLSKEIVNFALKFLRLSGTQELLRPIAQGKGAILTLHHVRPDRGHSFTPNAMLEITPEYLEATLDYIKRCDIDIVSLEEAILRMNTPQVTRFFVCFTIDDGCRDIAQFADPIFQKYNAPYTMFLVPDFIERKTGPWWAYLEDAVRELDQLKLTINGAQNIFSMQTITEKYDAFCKIYDFVRYNCHTKLVEVMDQMSTQYGKTLTQQAAQMCLDWQELKDLKQANPQLRFGAHSMSHAILKRLSDEDVWYEMTKSKQAIEEHTGENVLHFAYPVGDPTSAGNREYALAQRAKYMGAVTTRPGMLLDKYASTPTALPRVSLNGYFQSVEALETLLTGVPFLLYNRRLSVRDLEQTKVDHTPNLCKAS